jgi:outer membrane biosynthesis protein TonB
MKKSLFSFLGATALLVTFSACNTGPTEAQVEKMRADSLAKAQATADSILAAESAAKAKATQDSIDAAATAAVPAKAAPVAPVAEAKKGGKPAPKPAKKPVMKPATKPTSTNAPVVTPPAKETPKPTGAKSRTDEATSTTPAVGGTGGAKTRTDEAAGKAAGGDKAPGSGGAKSRVDK